MTIGFVGQVAAENSPHSSSGKVRHVPPRDGPRFSYANQALRAGLLSACPSKTSLHPSILPLFHVSIAPPSASTNLLRRLIDRRQRQIDLGLGHTKWRHEHNRVLDRPSKQPKLAGG